MSQALEEAPALDAAIGPAPPSLWRNRDFLLLWGGQAISTLGSSISGIVYPLLTLAITNSPAAAGVATALGSLPYLIFSLPVGALIDRWDRKRVMILCDLGRTISVVSVPIALALGLLTIWQLYLTAFIEGTLFVFFNIAEVAALPRVVVKTQLPAATAQNEATGGAAMLLGPPLGGLLYQTIGRGVPFLFDAVSYLVSVISLCFIRTRFQEQREAGAPRNLRAEIREGVTWLWRQPLIRFMAFLTGGCNLSNAGVFLIMIVLAKNQGANEAAIGAMFSVGAVGGIIGSIIGGPIQRRFRFGQVIPVTLWLQALLFPLLAVAPNPWAIGAIFAGIYLVTPVYNVVQFSYRLALIPDALQGRVNSSFRLIAYGFQPLGAFVAGLLLERLGAVPTVGVFAVWLIGLAILTTLNGHVRRAAPIAAVGAA
jgi:predicted MFS family arabinose efflux permease